ncbi:MAG: response regulator, partial [Methanospirillum sp.]|nr:response regulator [Methanospirillum sp.]
AYEALSLLPSRSFDVIVSDYDMPGMNGIDLLASLRNAGNTLPFILFTGRGREEVVIEALNRGASYYIRKGGAPGVLFTELAHIIQEAALKNKYEERIRESERLIYSVFHYLPDPAYAINNEGRVMAWNHGMEELTGIHEDYIVGKTGYAGIIPFYPPSIHVVADILLHSGVIPLDTWAILEEREGMILAEITSGDPIIPVTFRVKAAHLYDRDGKIIGAIESVRDVTIEKRKQSDLTEVNHYHRTLIESHMDPLITLSHDLVIRDVNIATEMLIGFSRTDLIGSDLDRWVVDPDRIRKVCDELISGGCQVSGYPLVLKSRERNREVFLYATSGPGSYGCMPRIFAELHEPIPSLSRY